MLIVNFLKKVKKTFSNSNYDALIKVLISKSALLDNLNEYKTHYPQIGFAPVLKSNAYGHGLVEVAKILDKEEKPFFVVDSLFEARTLRENGIKSDILIIGYTTPENITRSKLPGVAFTLTSMSQLETLSKTEFRVIKIHLKIDTGMHRQGIASEEIEKIIKIVKNNSNIILEGICSHLADADNLDDSFTQKQIKEWNGAVKIFKENFDSLKYFHLSASSGAQYSKDIEANVARLGIGLYGAIESNLKLKPILEMQTILSSIKTIQKEEGVGYNLTYKTPKIMRLATVPVGYFEGVDRRLSNIGFFKIGNNFCPIVGRVSMNITSIDISSVPEAKEGDKVVVLSNNPEDKNSVMNIAKTAGTISYKILVHIPQHLKRIVVD
ncbi:MAG: alanine racemase [Patescibacteria group bacterium]